MRLLAGARAAAKAIRDGAAIRATYAKQARRSKIADEKELRLLERELKRVGNDLEKSRHKEDALKRRKDLDDLIRSADDGGEHSSGSIDGGTESKGDQDGDHSGPGFEDEEDLYEEDDLDDEDDEDDEDDYDDYSGASDTGGKNDNAIQHDNSLEHQPEKGDKSEDEKQNPEASPDSAQLDEETQRTVDEERERIGKYEKILEMSPHAEEETEGHREEEKVDEDPPHVDDKELDSDPPTISPDPEPTEDTAKIDVDAVCAELGSKGSNAIVRSITYLRALFIAKLRRVLPNVLQASKISNSQHIDDCLQKAKSAKWEIESKKRDLEQKLEKIREKAKIDYGSDGALRKLHGTCSKKKIGQYEFELCPFDIAKQYEHGSAIATLGRFSGWEGEGAERRMLYPGGDQCWNGPSRSINVELLCGKAEDIISVDEPNRCTYSMKFETPAVCDEAAAKALLAEVERSTDGIKEEL